MSKLRYWISFPPKTSVEDPVMGTTIEHLTMESFLNKVFFNPIWNSAFAASLAQKNILDAFDEVEDTATGFFVEEEDFIFLKQACEKPRFEHNQSVYPGFGYSPSLAHYFVPFQAAVINALTEAQFKQHAKAV